MRRPPDIQQEIDEISTVHNLTGVYESISSTQVAKIKDKVELSKEFFNLLWGRYTSIRLDPKSYITNREDEGNGARRADDQAIDTDDCHTRRVPICTR